MESKQSLENAMDAKDIVQRKQEVQKDLENAVEAVQEMIYA